MFSCEVCEIFMNTFSYRTPPLTASAPPVAASVFFLKKVLLNSYFATLLWRTIFFSSRNIIWCIQSRTRLFINLSSIVRFSKWLRQGVPYKAENSGADPAFVIRGGPNSEHFLSNFRKLIKRGKFFLTTQSLKVKRIWVYTNQFIKTCFLKKTTFTWYFFGWFLFKNKARGGFENFEKGGGELIWYTSWSC